VIANWLARHGNPYPRGDLRHAQSFDEMEQDVRAVTVAQVQDFHQRFVSAARANSAPWATWTPRPCAGAAHGLGPWQQPAGGAAPFVRLPQPLVAGGG
jgi:zinc protease